MQRFTCRATILSRTDYGEADRIYNFLTPDNGKITAIAKGVRKSRSKLAGALEVFSISDVMFLPARKDIGTVMSARLVKHYGEITKNLERTDIGYHFLNMINKNTAEKPDEAYFTLLQRGLESLNNPEVDPQISKGWFIAQLLKLSGHLPELKVDGEGQKLNQDKKYTFDLNKMKFEQNGNGRNSFGKDQIKFLRLLFSKNGPDVLQKVQAADGLAKQCNLLIDSMFQAHLQL